MSNSTPEPKLTTYYIYTLTDPRTGKVYYVGYTKNFKRRYSNHLREPLWGNAYKVTSQILAEGMKPIMTVVDKIHTHDKRIAHDAELAWMQEMIDRNQPLVNKLETGMAWRIGPQTPMAFVAFIKQHSTKSFKEYTRLRLSRPYPNTSQYIM